MIYKCIIIDDEPHFTELMKEYISEIPQLELVKIFHDPARAMVEVSEEDHIDIVFLDIHMPHLTGIELAPHFKKKTRFLIFVTAHSQHAAQAFDLEADDFLFKPFRLERLRQAVDKITSKAVELKLREHKNDDFFYIKPSGTQSKYIKILYSEIIAFESDKNYIKLYTPNGYERIYMGIKEVEKRLAGRSDFMRIHRSFIISTEHIDHVDYNNVIMKNSKVRIIIGNRYRDAFFEYLESKKF